MQTNIRKRFFSAAKGKVIVGFLLAGAAIFAAWGISKFAFTKMQTTVEEISAPNDRLRIVNKISHSISRMDQLQRDQAVNNQGKSSDFARESGILRRSLDTLSTLYVTDKSQLRRIKSIKKLLSDRDKQFLMYLQVRETLVNTKSFSAEVDKLTKMIGQRNQPDSSVVMQTSTSTTTLEPQEEEKSRGFLSKLFGKKKSEVYKIISEEYQVKRDTVNPAAEDSIVSNIESTLKTIETEQRVKSSRFLRREADLATASTAITQQMLNILREVEAEAVTQVDTSSAQAKSIISNGINQISWILIGFFLLTLLLAYLILSDITNINRYRKELEITKDEAEYHSKAKQRFLSNMSHEIRTPLQSILGYSELVSKQDNPKKKDLDAIYQSSVHLLQIVNEVLDYNRIISGEFAFNNQPFNLVKVLDEVVSVMGPLAAKKSIKLFSDFDLDGVDYVDGDAFRLKQILFNLIGNAIKFTIKGSISLNLSVKSQADLVHLNFMVTDTGIGFNEEDINRIFNEFEQIESKEKYIHNQTGSGLGLAIVKSLVEGQQGRINVKSKKNKGTTFTVHLSYGYAEKPADEDVSTAHFTISNTGKIWIIDDDNLILELCSLIFERNNLAYQAFNNADSVLSAKVDPNINYVLIDMRLPEMTGLELHRILKRKMPRHVKFYAVTAQVLPDEREAILAEGFEGLIMKPFKADDIMSIFEKTVVTMPKTDFDLTALEKMTMGDEELLEKILVQFKKDCEEDRAALKGYLEENNQDEARLITHRLAGRLAQVGATILAGGFRDAELKVAAQLNDNIKRMIADLLIKLDELLVDLTVNHHSMP